jgi:hypothetical protein
LPMTHGMEAPKRSTAGNKTTLASAYSAIPSGGSFPSLSLCLSTSALNVT